MARVLLVIMMVCACFCVTGCKKKESATGTNVEKDAVKKANTATREVEGTLNTMSDMQ